ncbi:MAG: dephospho-CoA kinase [Christensenellales bacterium]|jgi:dephospho-CoA kinase
MRPNKIIAITGGIGSGKSMVRRILAALGAYTIDADKVNKELMRQPSYIAEVAKLFPQAVRNGAIDRNVLREIIFSDKEALIKMNALAHPLITGLIICEAESAGENVFVEIPLINDTGIYKNFDGIWYVNSDLETRISRVMKRDDLDREIILKIINSQGDGENIKRMAASVIDNDFNEEKLWATVQKLYLSL